MINTFAPGITDVKFLNGHHAQALTLSPQQTSAQALAMLGLDTPQPTLVIIGGAGFMTAESLERLQTVFNDVLAPLAQDLNLTVLDGGTDAGVIHMMGQARQHIGGTFPLIGVAPQGKVRLPANGTTHGNESTYELEPNHTNFLLIPGQDWGSESPWLAEFAMGIGAGQPALTILINGGKIALVDLIVNLQANRPTLVLSGSGRLADEVAAAMEGTADEVNPKIQELIHRYRASGRLGLVDFAMPIDEMRDRIRRYFVSSS